MATLPKLIHHRDDLLAHIRDHEWSSGDLFRIAKGDIYLKDISSIRILSTIILVELMISEIENGGEND